MGGCVSSRSSSQSNCSSSNGETAPSPCLEIGFFGQKRSKKTFLEHHIAPRHLQSIPNRIIMNGKCRSSCIFTQQGRKGINQDAMIAWEDFISEDTIFCGIFDGHGPYGHLVAREVRDALPVKLHSALNSCASRQTEPGATPQEKLNSLWREAFLKSYKAMDKELKSHPTLNCFCSGSTAVTIVKQGLNLFIGYIGDSRAILGSKGSDDSMVAIQLSVDMKPDLPREAERIKKCKGRVFAMEDEPDVHRVWLPFDDAPGLAMARAFGDLCLKDFGVISIPEFSHRLLTDRDQFIVLASDGVWDVLSNEEVVEIVASAPTRSSASRLVVDAANREWKLKYPTSKIDDCAVVCLFLEGKVDSESDCEEPRISSTLSSNALESDEGQRPESRHFLKRNFTVRSSEESDSYIRAHTDSEGNGEAVGVEEQNWSGLEGVTRVNSLVQLPRFADD